LLLLRITNLQQQNNMNKLKYIAAVLIAIAGFGLQQAKAFESDLSVGNSGISGFAGPYAHVSITLTSSTTATVTFTSLTNNGNIYLMGDGGSVALNVNAASFSVGPIVGTNAGTGFTPGPLTFAGGGTEDGFGGFNLTINSFDGFTHSSDTITFTLTNLSGTWASQADVVTVNGFGFDAAAHIFVTTAPANASNSALATGFAAEPGVGVPDGGTTVMLLGAGLGALGMVRRFLKM
jgi:VPDSG-CTERM motif